MDIACWMNSYFWIDENFTLFKLMGVLPAPNFLAGNLDHCICSTNCEGDALPELSHLRIWFWRKVKRLFPVAPVTCIPRPRRCQHRGGCISWYLRRGANKLFSSNSLITLKATVFSDLVQNPLLQLLDLGHREAVRLGNHRHNGHLNLKN